MAKRSKHRRMSREDVRKNARDSNTSGGNWFTLPEGVRQYAIEKKSKVEMNILPYEVTSKNHPDGIEPGILWYRYQFRVHHQIVPDDLSVVCTTSVG
ncbi:MAG: hypothetical protein IIC67_09625, partial [Thaumarchaeota archaeon]|nr:hypothetical protein [Nitrososphaerota archaeon]